MKTHRYILFIIACVLSIGTGWAGNWGNNKTYYYRGTAKTADTKMGSVYASISNERPTSGYKDNMNTDKENSFFTYTYYTPRSVTASSSTNPSATVYFYAQAKDGYQFDYWVDGNDNKIYGEDASATFTITSTNDGSPTEVTYTAHFKAIEKLKVASEEGGNASMEKTSDNHYKLTAHNRFDYAFAGWYVDDATTPVSTDMVINDVNTSSFTKTKTYTAKWTPKTVTYYRLRNQNGYYLSVVGNQGSSITHKDGSTDIFDGFKLDGTIKLTNTNVTTDPGTILKITSGDFKNNEYGTFNIEAQGLSLQSIMSNYILSVSGLGLAGTFSLIWDGNNSYQIKDKNQGYYIQSVGASTDGYFVGTTYSGANNDTWYFEPVDEEYIDSYYFGVVPERHAANGKHYTTLYTSFPYECKDGIKPYYADNVSAEGVANCYEITSGKVPAFTPVILECTSTNAASNRLVPLSDSDASDHLETTNLMKGNINLYTASTTQTTSKTFNSSGTMSDFSLSSNPRYFDLNSNDDPIFKTGTTSLESNKGYLICNYTGEILLIELWNPSLDIYVEGELDEEAASAEDFIAAQKENPNIMAVVLEEFEGSFKNIDNIIIQRGHDAATATYDCANFVLTDKINWGSPVSFTAKSGSYERSNVGGLNSVCMPFAISTSDLPEGSTIYTLNSIDTEKDEADFSAVSSVAAGTPCLIQCADDAALWDFLLSNASVTPEIASVAMQGSYTKKTLGTGYWKVNSDGTKLTNTTASSTITPFRSYVAVPEGMPAKALKIIFTTPTGIKNYDKVLTNDAAFYGIDGRETKTLRKGINIVRNADGSTRKILK